MTIQAAVHLKPHHKRLRQDPSPDYWPNDPLLTAGESAKETSRGLSTFWRDVKNGTLPKPLYINPRSPRWRVSTLRAAVVVEGSQA